MTKVSQAALSLAECTYSLEAASSCGSEHSLSIAARILQKMNEPLSRLAGPMGYKSLVSRAIALIQKNHPSLQSLRLTDSGDLDVSAALKAGEATEVNSMNETLGILLLAHLLDLLTTFIGEPLTVSVLKDVWPNASFEKVNLRFEVKS